MRIIQEPIRLNDFLSSAPGSSCGALASFVGFVRDHDHGRQVLRLHYECYPSMAEKMLKEMKPK